MNHNTPRTRKLLAAAPVLAFALLAACGSDEESDSSTTVAATVASTAAPATEPPATEAPDTTAAAGGETVEVVASDYAFGGIPETVTPGTKFTLTNSSDAELHEMVAIRIPDEETRSVEELVQLPEEEIDAIFGAGPPAFVLIVPPGSDEVIPAVGDGTVTEPGRYAVVCFIPEGADPQAMMEAMQSGEEGPPPADPNAGPPHAALGMIGEFTVEG